MTWCVICNQEWKNHQLAVSCCILPTLKSISENETYSHMKQAILDFINELEEKGCHSE